MAIDFSTNPGGLFPRLGRLGKALLELNLSQADYDAALSGVAAQFASTLKDVYGPLAAQQSQLVQGVPSNYSAVQQVAQSVLQRMVADDVAAAGRNLDDALREVIRQMRAGSVSVKACTVASTVAALGTPTGTGKLVATTKRGDGLVQENLFAEVGRLVCLADSYSGGQTAGQEPFRYIGEGDEGRGEFDYLWPAGSAALTGLTAISADTDASATGNLTTNGDAESWTGTTPALDNWVLAPGTWGTDIAQNASSPYRGTYDVRFVAGTGVNTALAQTFDDSTGSAVALTPLTSYAFCAWMKRGGVVSAGVLTVELVDGSGTVINDEQGTANSFTQTLSALTTSYAAVTGFFRLPAIPPAVVKLRLRISTALTGASVYVDDICLAPVTEAYTGGPGLCVFSGVTPFKAGDQWTATQTNDRGGASNLATFQALFDRLFGMRGRGLLLPSAGSPTLADTLIQS